MKKIILIFLMINFASLIYSTDISKKLTSYYNQNTIEIGFNPWFGINLELDGQELKTNFGGSETLYSTLSSYEESLHYAEQFRFKNRAGSILLYSGLGSMAGSYAYLNTSKDNFDGTVMTSLFLGGFISYLSGAIIQGYSIKDLLKSVKSYNQNVISEYTE